MQNFSIEKIGAHGYHWALKD